MKLPAGRHHALTPSITHDIAIVGTMRVSRKPASNIGLVHAMLLNRGRQRRRPELEALIAALGLESDERD